MPLPDQTLSSLTAALTYASRAYRAAADKVAADFGLSQATGLPVLIINRCGDEGVRPGVLAEMLSLEPSSLVRIVDQLISNGLVARHEDPQDRRARILCLTDEGQKTAGRMEQALRPFRRKLFGDFPEADVEACLRVLSGLPGVIANLTAADPTAASSSADSAAERKQA